MPYCALKVERFVLGERPYIKLQDVSAQCLGFSGGKKAVKKIIVKRVVAVEILYVADERRARYLKFSGFGGEKKRFYFADKVSYTVNGGRIIFRRGVLSPEGCKIGRVILRVGQELYSSEKSESENYLLVDISGILVEACRNKNIFDRAWLARCLAGACSGSPRGRGYRGAPRRSDFDGDGRSRIDLVAVVERYRRYSEFS